MNKVSAWRSWVVMFLIWLSVAFVLYGFARLERGLEKRNTLQYIHDGTAGAWTIAGATVMGGSGSDTGRAVARSKNGDIYLLARADRNLLDAGEPNGEMDVFVFWLDGETGEVLGDISVGGSGHDDGVAIAVEDDGDVVIAGTTTSTDFPAVRLKDVPAEFESTSSFVVRFSADLSAVRRNILLGGNGHIVVQDMLTSPDGRTYLVGSTSASDFPSTRNAYQKNLADRAEPMDVDYGADGFLMALDESLLKIEAATLFGGERDDYPYVLQRTADGSLVVAGNTASSNFPITVTPEPMADWEPRNSSLFVSVFDRGLTRLLASAHWGSYTSDFLGGMALGADGRVHLCGHTTSDFFPLTPDAAGVAHSGGHFDMFYAVMSRNLSVVDYASYIGGGNNEICHGVEVMESGEVIVNGETSSVELLGADVEYPGEGVRGSFFGRVEQGSTSIIAALKAFDSTIIYDMLMSENNIWLAGFTAAKTDNTFTREQLATLPAGRDILNLRIARPAPSASDGAGQ